MSSHNWTQTSKHKNWDVWEANLELCTVCILTTKLTTKLGQSNHKSTHSSVTETTTMSELHVSEDEYLGMDSSYARDSLPATAALICLCLLPPWSDSCGGRGGGREHQCQHQYHSNKNSSERVFVAQHYYMIMPCLQWNPSIADIMPNLEIS